MYQTKLCLAVECLLPANTNQAPAMHYPMPGTVNALCGPLPPGSQQSAWRRQAQVDLPIAQGEKSMLAQWAGAWGWIRKVTERKCFLS